MSKAISAAPGFSVEKYGTCVRLAFSGACTISASRALEKNAADLLAAAKGAGQVLIDCAAIVRLDTAGAWVIDRARTQMAEAGVAAEYAALTADQQTLLREAAYHPTGEVAPRPPHILYSLLVDLGKSVVGIGDEIYGGVAFLGEVVSSALKVVFNPKLARPTAFVYHIEAFGLRSVPIIVTINFLVGCIVAQQGLFQLRRFGASVLAVDLLGVLILREMGVLLTSIMIAGRSGSAITAEIGSMKMREEIDALKVMGLSPMDVLVLPRLMALIVALPLLTFLGDMAALFGGMLTAWGYGGINPLAFGAELKDAIGVNTFMVGIIKAPFMA